MTPSSPDQPVADAGDPLVARLLKPRYCIGQKCSFDRSRAADRIKRDTAKIARLTQERDEARQGLAKGLADMAASYLPEIARVSAERDALQAEIARLTSALEPFCFGDPVLETILYGDMPDDATGTFTIKLRDLRRARAALSPDQNPKGQP